MKYWLNKLLLVGWMDGTSTCDTNQIQIKFEFTLVCSSVFLFVVVAIIQLLSHVPLFETPVDCSPPSSSAHGIFQTRILEWVALSYSRGSS